MDIVIELKSLAENDIYLRCLATMLNMGRPRYLSKELDEHLDAINKKIWEEIVKTEKRLNKLESEI